MAKQFEKGIVEEMGYISFGARVEIVHAQNVAAVSEEVFAEMRPDESGTAGNKDAPLVFFFHRILPYLILLFDLLLHRKRLFRVTSWDKDILYFQ